MVDTDEFDAPDLDDVLQEEIDPEQIVVPVRTEGIVRTDEMPCRIGACRNIYLPPNSNARKILEADPRRKRVTFWPHLELGANCDAICIATSQNEAEVFAGALIWSGGQAISRYEFTITDEIWARPALINVTSGALTSIVVATHGAIVSVLTEQWAR